MCFTSDESPLTRGMWLRDMTQVCVSDFKTATCSEMMYVYQTTVIPILLHSYVGASVTVVLCIVEVQN